MGGYANFSQDFVKNMVSTMTATAASVTGVSADGTSETINLLTCPPGSSCYQTKHNSYLKNAFLEAQKKYEVSPIDLSRAEKNYYVSTDGPAAYDSLISTRFNETVNEFRQNSIDRQQQLVAELSQILKQYQAQTVFQVQSAGLISLRTNEQNDLINKINYYKKILQTSERRVVFENKNMDSLYNYRRSILFLYYASIISFMIFGNFIPDRLYKRFSVWVLIVIVSIIPVILNMTVMWLFIFYDTLSYWMGNLPYKDVYSKLGDTWSEGPPQATPQSIAAILSAASIQQPTQCQTNSESAPVSSPVPAGTVSSGTSSSGTASSGTSSGTAASSTAISPAKIASLSGMPALTPTTLATMSTVMPASMLSKLGRV